MPLYGEIDIRAHYFPKSHGKFLCDAFFGTGYRMIRSQLQFMTSAEHFDRMFAYRVFGKIKRTCVKVLSLADGQSMDDFLFYTKRGSIVGEGIHFYYSFSFPREGEVLCAYTSQLHDSGTVTRAYVIPEQ
jgi:hypothetical protein